MKWLSGLYLLILVAWPAVAGEAPSPEWAVAVFPSGAEFQLELAVDPQTRARGYMFREQIGSREGMLFLFPSEARHGFWMKNCKIELDIIWLDPRLSVVDIAHRQPPCPERGECPTVRPLRPARYVLEVAGGTARSEDLNVGDRIEILSEPSLF